jgi:hypothetical protein
MKLSRTIKRSTASMALGLLTVVAIPTLAVSTALAANIQEEAAIYAGNVTQGTQFTHAGVSAKDNDVVAFEVYYHDLESPDSGLDATNVRIKATVPTTDATVHSVGATVQADNSNQVNDSTTITTSDDTQLQFIPGTVTWKHDVGTNASPQWVTQTISDSVVTSPSGAIVDQNEQPSNNFAGTIVFEAKVVGETPTPPTPTYACTILGLTAEANRTVKISNFATTQTNATFSNATIAWGDKTETTSASPIGQTHQYAADGKYTVTATANFNVGGQTKSATSESCTQVVTFSSTTPPTVTPPTTPPVTPPATPAAPTALVNTGPGSVIGLFAATSIGGMALYRRLLARRLSQQ